MSLTIKTLPPEVINLIAAGELIDSFAAVIRELVENSLDAGATRITISVWLNAWRVQVIDNGKGMGLSDLRICAKSHTTSKIHNIEDIHKISTLGFRGEALHSLAQLADLEIVSRSRSEDDIGWHVVYHQENIISETPKSVAFGTIITVNNLFGSIPVRRQGLPEAKQQLKKIQDTITKIAICYPQITWCARQNDRNWFSISPGNNSQEILPQIIKKVKIHDLQFLKLIVEKEREILSENQPENNNLETTEQQIELVLGLPDRCHRNKADWVKIAVNGRIIKSPQLEEAITTATARILPKDRHPICFIHLHISPNQIDWNRHPAKREIYLHSLEFWQAQIIKIIEQALKINSDTLPQKWGDGRIGEIIKVAEKRGKYTVKSQDKTKVNSGKANQDEIGLIQLKAVAQLHKTYIVAEHQTGVWLIEQHIAHERILYEKLQDNWQLVPLKKPIILKKLKEKQIKQIERLGLEIEEFGKEIWAIRNVPEMLKTREDIEDALIELSWGGDLQTAQVATACRSAIRNGTPLNLEEMQNILDQWKNTRNPRTCPHGRPIFLSLEESTLARFFRRHWVIGKSHGI